MAHEGIQTIIPGLVTNGDFSTKQFYFVSPVAGSAFTVKIATVDGAPVIGVNQGTPSHTGEAVAVCGWGMTKAIAGETISAGDFVKTASDGRANICDITTTGADTGDHVVGWCVSGGLVNEKITIMFGVPYFKVAV